MNSPKADPRDWWPDTQAMEIPDSSDGTHLSIGDILRRQKNFTPAQIEQILLLQRERGIKFGQAAVRLNLASESEVLWALSQQFHYPYAANRPSSPLHEELVMANGPFSSEVECFRILRSQLTMGILSATATPRRALAIVSPDIGDGKTFVLSNLAALIAGYQFLRGERYAHWETNRENAPTRSATPTIAPHEVR